MLWLGSLVAVLLSIGLDLARARGAGALALAGGAALLALPLPLLGAILHLAGRRAGSPPGPPTPGALDRAAPYALAALVAGPPSILAAVRLVPAWPSPARWALPGVLAAGAALFAASLLAARRLAGPEAPRLQRSACAGALALAALFLSVHLGEGTLAAVRPGTAPLHLALYLGTWIASAALVAPWGAALSGDRPASMPARVRIALGAAGLAIGLLLAAADRRLLVDLYPAVHRWLGWTGLISMAAGVALLLGALAGGSPAWGRARIAALALLVASAAGFAASVPWLSPGARAVMAGAPTGKTLLGMMGPGRRPAGPLPEHPLLRVDQRLDAPGPAGAPNILLVTVDALRADQVDAPLLRRLNTLARNAVRFRRAYTQGTRTALAMSALMLGRYCANIDYRLLIYRGGTLVDPRTLTREQIDAFGGRFVYTTVPSNPAQGMLAERLHRAGLWTAAAPFAGKNEFFHKGGDFDHGFDRFADLTSMEWAKPTSPEVVKVAIEELDLAKDKARWFLWVHFYDPHEAGGNAERYARHMKTFDASLGALLDALGDRGLMKRTILVLTADHGEALGEHGHHGHSTSLYDEEARVPLLVAVPGVPGRDVREPVALVDVTATLAAAAGADTKDLDGVNLWPLILAGEPPAERPIFLELHRYYSNEGTRTTDLKGVVLGDWKLVQDRMKGTEELFDLIEDPIEADNRVSRDADRAGELRAVLDSFVSRAEASHPLP